VSRLPTSASSSSSRPADFLRGTSPPPPPPCLKRAPRGQRRARVRQRCSAAMTRSSPRPLAGATTRVRVRVLVLVLVPPGGFLARDARSAAAAMPKARAARSTTRLRTAALQCSDDAALTSPSCRRDDPSPRPRPCPRPRPRPADRIASCAGRPLRRRCHA
jgi:hypothetical protein